MLAQHLSGGADDEAEHGNAHTSVCDLSFPPCVLFPSAVCAVEGFQQHRLRYEEGLAVVLQYPDCKKEHLKWCWWTASWVIPQLLTGRFSEHFSSINEGYLLLLILVGILLGEALRARLCLQQLTCVSCVPAESTADSGRAARTKDPHSLQRLRGSGQSSGLRQTCRQTLDPAVSGRQGSTVPPSPAHLHVFGVFFFRNVSIISIGIVITEPAVEW